MGTLFSRCRDAASSTNSSGYDQESEVDAGLAGAAPRKGARQFPAAHTDVAWRVASIPATLISARHALCTASTDEGGRVVYVNWDDGSVHVRLDTGDDDASPIVSLDVACVRRRVGDEDTGDAAQGPGVPLTGSVPPDAERNLDTGSIVVSGIGTAAGADDGKGGGDGDAVWIACGSRSGKVRLWRGARGADGASLLEGHRKAVTAMCFVQRRPGDASHGRGPDHECAPWLVTGSRDYTVRVWDTETGTCVASDKTQRNVVTTLTAIADGPRGARESSTEALVFQGSEDLTYRVWTVDRATGELDLRDQATAAASPGIPEHFPLSSAAHPSLAGVFVTGHNGFDGGGCSLLLWDAATVGEGPIARFDGAHEQAVAGVAFLGDAHLASVSRDAQVRLWEWSPVQRPPAPKLIAETTVSDSGQLTSIAALRPRSTSEDTTTHPVSEAVVTSMSGALSRIRFDTHARTASIIAQSM